MPTARRSRAKRWRVATLLAVHALAGVHLLHGWLFGRTLAPVEPSEAFDTIHLGALTVGFLFLAGAVAATALFGRFFCGWGCHLVALQDLCAWLLAKLRVPTKPLRSRTLVWVPALAALYLFVWPQVERVWRGDPLPSLHVVTDPEGWTSFTTNDLLRSFSGATMTVVTLAVCGLATVYFLGNRGFCAYACPYGAIFGVAERLAPLRIVAGDGDCAACGLCTANCQSNVSVIEEIRLHGAVVDSNCMKDLDCVSACPTDALRYGLAKPTVLRGVEGSRRAPKPYDFSPLEDGLMAAVFVFTLPVVRGLYDAISFLLALAVAGLVAYAAVIGTRLLSNPSVSWGSQPLKENDRLTPPGRAAAVVLVTGAVLLAHSALIRGHIYAGERAAQRVASDAGPGDERLASAISRLSFANRWGLLSPPGLRRTLASLQLRAGDPDSARRNLNALLATDRDSPADRVLLGQSWLLSGRAALAERELRLAVASDAQRDRQERLALATAHRLLADLAADRGDLDEAEGGYQAALALDAGDFDARMALATLAARSGDTEAAVASFLDCLGLRPNSAAVHNNLAALLAAQGDKQAALQHSRLAVEAEPDNALTHANLGRLLLDLGEPADARSAYEAALRLAPGLEEARRGLQRATRRDTAPPPAD